ncbi:hypothetical protein ACQUFY_12340 [Robbsia andropogonis]|uniref:hypothetical protein n=1 Tax=Robbsia andropogonis TaxID=28092 RepID=UPI003D1BF2F0
MPIDATTPTPAARRAMQARYAGLSPRQARAVQKELLIARAALERLSIAEASTDLRGDLSGLGVFGLIGRLFGRSRSAETGLGTLLSAVPAFMQPAIRAVLPLLSHHPLFAGVVSLLVGASQGGALQKAGKSAKWAGLAVVALKTLGWARRAQSWRTQRQARKAARRREV